METTPDKEASWSLACGAGGLLLQCCCGPLAFPVSVMGVALGVRALGAKGRGQRVRSPASAWGGIVLGGLGLLLQLASLAFYIFAYTIDGADPFGFAPYHGADLAPYLGEPRPDGEGPGLQLPPVGRAPVEILPGLGDERVARVETVFGPADDSRELAERLGHADRTVVAVLHGEPRFLPLGGGALVVFGEAATRDLPGLSFERWSGDASMTWQPLDCAGDAGRVARTDGARLPARMLDASTGVLRPYRLRPLTSDAAADASDATLVGSQIGGEEPPVRGFGPQGAPLALRARITGSAAGGERPLLVFEDTSDGRLIGCRAP